MRLTTLFCVGKNFGRWPLPIFKQTAQESLTTKLSHSISFEDCVQHLDPDIVPQFTQVNVQAASMASAIMCGTIPLSLRIQVVHKRAVLNGYILTHTTALHGDNKATASLIGTVEGGLSLYHTESKVVPEHCIREDDVGVHHRRCRSKVVTKRENESMQMALNAWSTDFYIPGGKNDSIAVTVMSTLPASKPYSGHVASICFSSEQLHHSAPIRSELELRLLLSTFPRAEVTQTCT